MTIPTRRKRKCCGKSSSKSALGRKRKEPITRWQLDIHQEVDQGKLVSNPTPKTRSKIIENALVATLFQDYELSRNP
jgi:hypothetical protein